MKSVGRTVAALTGVALVAWLLDTLWNQTFAGVETEPVKLTDAEGRLRPGKRVRVTSVFDAPPDIVWAKVTTPALLTYVTYPLLSFRRQNGEPLPEIWREGDSLQVNLVGLSCIPLGPHTIHTERIDAERREIQSRESGRVAKIWWHFISVNEYPAGQTLYTDEIDIYAGPLTGVVAAFARFFYRYRQTRWRTVIRKINQ
jgi:ligand-binding SRPBCC domain-containing protein